MNYSFEDFLLYRNLIYQKKSIQIRIVSDSMAPFISINEMLEVQPLNGEPKRFDVIVFWESNKLVCHFLWKVHVDNEYFFFKSLKHPRKTDDPVERQNVLGQVPQKKLSLYYKLKIFILNTF